MKSMMTGTLWPAPRLLFAALAMCLVGCGKTGAMGGDSPSLRSASVQVQTVASKSRAATEEVVGTVRPKLSASLEAKVSGRVAQMLVVPGQPVTNGELLVHLDAPEIGSRLDQANAALEQAEHDWKRISTLFSQQASTRSEYDAANEHYRVAKGAAAEANAMMSYCDVVAPFDGVITRKLADVGDLAMPGKSLLQMENPGALRLEADVPEALIGNLKLGDQLMVHGASAADGVDGTVAELAPAADPNSRTFMVKLDLPSTTSLRSGQFGRVAVPVGEVNSIRIPATAVIQRGQMEIVFVVSASHAQMRLIRTGNHLGDEIEVVSGLEADEQIVTVGAGQLTDGQPLTIKP